MMVWKEFRIYEDFDNPLFLAKDVAGWIEYDPSSINKMIVAVDDTEKVRNIIPTLGGNQESWFLTEDGLYDVLMQSRKPIYKLFPWKKGGTQYSVLPDSKGLRSLQPCGCFLHCMNN